MISRAGVEGGAIYSLSAPLREGAALTLDLFPDLDAETLAARLARGRKGESGTKALRRMKLDAAKRALVMELARPLPKDPAALAAVLKALPLSLDGPQGMERAISSAGGLRLSALDAQLMLRDRPGFLLRARCWAGTRRPGVSADRLPGHRPGCGAGGSGLRAPLAQAVAGAARDFSDATALR